MFVETLRVCVFRQLLLGGTSPRHTGACFFILIVCATNTLNSRSKAGASGDVPRAGASGEVDEQARRRPDAQDAGDREIERGARRRKTHFPCVQTMTACRQKQRGAILRRCCPERKHVRHPPVFLRVLTASLVPPCFAVRVSHARRSLRGRQIMRAESEACAHEAVRLDQATAKLHTLSGELDGRRKAMLETRKAEAAEETSRRYKDGFVSGCSRPRPLEWPGGMRAWLDYQRGLDLVQDLPAYFNDQAFLVVWRKGRTGRGYVMRPRRFGGCGRA